MLDKKIKSMTNKELDALLVRLRKENEARDIIAYRNPKPAIKPKVANKSVTIKDATDEELDILISRLGRENHLQNIIADIKRQSASKNSVDGSIGFDSRRSEISTEVPIKDLYHKSNKILEHFGILGMKWGIRRPVGPDGLVKRKTLSEDYIKSRELKKKGAKALSTQELQDLTKRMNFERQLRDLSISEVTKGADYAKAALAVTTTVSSLYAISKTPAGKAIKDGIMKALKKKYIKIS